MGNRTTGKFRENYVKTNDSYNNGPTAEFPGITPVAQPIDAVVATRFEILPGEAVCQVVFEPGLIVRQSTTNPDRHRRQEDFRQKCSGGPKPTATEVIGL
jgi:hypothetical protein